MVRLARLELARLSTQAFEARMSTNSIISGYGGPYRSRTGVHRFADGSFYHSANGPYHGAVCRIRTYSPEGTVLQTATALQLCRYRILKFYIYCFIDMVATVGVEPTTLGFSGRRSTVELRRHSGQDSRIRTYALVDPNHAL